MSANYLKGMKGFQKIHGQTRTAVHHVWIQMKQRCLNSSHKNYKDYGGRGISVCKQWVLSFERFRDDMGPRPPGMTLERIDNNGPYSPDNRRWANRADQSRNQREHGRIINLNGKAMNVTNWAKEVGLPRHVVLNRLAMGWDESRAVFTPPRYLKGRSHA